jgi:hypothetical protein
VAVFMVVIVMAVMVMTMLVPVFGPVFFIRIVHTKNLLV